MPACPLATVLYRFDDTARFPVFESHTTAKGPVAIRADGDEAGGFLRIDYRRHEADPDEITIVLALPLVAVDGRLRKLLLDVFGDAGDCHLHLEGMDGRGDLLGVRFGLAMRAKSSPQRSRALGLTAGWRTLRADASKLVPPVQFHRLRVSSRPREAWGEVGTGTRPAESALVRLGLRTLSITGEVRFPAKGIA